jgi:DnaK suppressor protein
VPRRAVRGCTIIDAAAIDRIRRRLQAERRRVIDQIDYLSHSVEVIVEGAEWTSTDDEHDPEGATIAYERALALALLRQAHDDLGVLDVAMARLEDGSITTCVMCDGPIPLERLLALPGVRSCIRCAS